IPSRKAKRRTISGVTKISCGVCTKLRFASRKNPKPLPEISMIPSPNSGSAWTCSPPSAAASPPSRPPEEGRSRVSTSVTAPAGSALVDKEFGDSAESSRPNRSSRPQNSHACSLQSARQVQWCLTTKLDEHALWFFLIANIEHVFEGQRLEVKFVARVVIRGNRLRIRVDHDRFESEFAQSERRVHAAIVEFDSLADPVRSAAEDDDFALGAIAPLVLVAIRRVIIRRVSFKLGCTSIDEAIGRQDPQRLPLRADFSPSHPIRNCELPIRKSELLRAKQIFGLQTSRSRHDVRHIPQKPPVDLR